MNPTYLRIQSCWWRCNGVVNVLLTHFGPLHTNPSTFECLSLSEYCGGPWASLKVHNLPPSNVYFLDHNAPCHQRQVVSHRFREHTNETWIQQNIFGMFKVLLWAATHSNLNTQTRWHLHSQKTPSSPVSTVNSRPWISLEIVWKYCSLFLRNFFFRITVIQWRWSVSMDTKRNS